MKKLLVLVPIFTVLIVLFTPATNVLTITNRKNTAEHVISRDAYKKGFVISYTHSVNKGRVHDYYKILPDRQIQLYETEFVSYGAGMPEPIETPGAYFEVTDAGYFIRNLNRTMSQFMMAVGVIANHTILVGHDMEEGLEVPFRDFFPPQTSLIFKISKVSLFTLITSRKL